VSQARPYFLVCRIGFAIQNDMALPRKTTAVLLFALTLAIGVRLELSGYFVAAYALVVGVFVALLAWTLSENRR
jgi:hypothetical protein